MQRFFSMIANRFGAAVRSDDGHTGAPRDGTGTRSRSWAESANLSRSSWQRKSSVRANRTNEALPNPTYRTYMRVDPNEDRCLVAPNRTVQPRHLGHLGAEQERTELVEFDEVRSTEDAAGGRRPRPPTPPRPSERRSSSASPSPPAPLKPDRREDRRYRDSGIQDPSSSRGGQDPSSSRSGQDPSSSRGGQDPSSSRCSASSSPPFLLANSNSGTFRRHEPPATVATTRAANGPARSDVKLWPWCAQTTPHTPPYGIHVYLLHDRATMPLRSTPTSVSFDLYSPRDLWIPAGERVHLGLGIGIETPFGLYGTIVGRSIVSACGLLVLPSIIAPMDRSEVHVTLINFSRQSFQLRTFERFAQLLFNRHVSVNIMPTRVSPSLGFSGGDNDSSPSDADGTACGPKTTTASSGCRMATEVSSDGGPTSPSSARASGPLSCRDDRAPAAPSPSPPPPSSTPPSTADHRSAVGKYGHGNRSPEHGSRSPEHGNRSPEHGNRSPEHGNRSPEHGNRSPAVMGALRQSLLARQPRFPLTPTTARSVHFQLPQRGHPSNGVDASASDGQPSNRTLVQADVHRTLDGTAIRP